MKWWTKKEKKKPKKKKERQKERKKDRRKERKKDRKTERSLPEPNPLELVPTIAMFVLEGLECYQNAWLYLSNPLH